jgi:glycosyltransferase involved in cell wall biosynthesis
MSLWRKLVLAWCCRLARVPYVAQMHSGGFSSWLSRSRLNRIAATSLFSHAAVSIVLAEQWRADVEGLGARGVAVIPNGITRADYEALQRCRGLRPTSVGGGHPVLLFYGRWAPVKGVDRLAAALRALPHSRYEVHLYGNGDRRWLLAQFDGLRGAVCIGGWLGGEAKLGELAGAAALIAPSRAEGFPTALVEARAAGVPVLASNVGAVPDALAGYETAVLVPPDDDAALRKAICAVLAGAWPPGPDGSDFPPCLYAEHAVERLLELYGSVAAERR